jgi:Uma2 family endonuclease
MTTPDTLRTRRWTRREYEQLLEAGICRPDERLELVDGALVVREPHDGEHAAAIRRADGALRRAFGAGWEVRVQLPVVLDEDSEPEPDVAVVSAAARDRHPARPALVVEVAESSLALDRGLKCRIYARAGVVDYWIVNLVDGVLEVHREPAPRYGGWAYRSIRTCPAGVSVVPLVARGTVRVADLLG